MGITIVDTVQKLRACVSHARQQNQKIAFVPTMGALHAGHLSLIDMAKERADYVVCSIFVNPKQFGENEDLDKYPRPLEDDIRALDTRHTELLFTPTVQEMFPDGFSTTISVDGISQGLCGSSRQGHFDGVATIVAKLLLQVQPDFALFGEKDFQQLMVIKRMVRDLNIDVEIVGAPIIREKDGLALSSRNQYLSANERQIAPKLYDLLKQLTHSLNEGETIDSVLKEGNSKLEDYGFRVDYLEVRDELNLEIIEATSILSYENHHKYRLFAAVYLGQTRLIDNIAI